MLPLFTTIVEVKKTWWRQDMEKVNVIDMGTVYETYVSNTHRVVDIVLKIETWPTIAD